jgi:hypothetical protein
MAEREDEEWIEKFRAAVSESKPPRTRRVAAAIGRLLGKASNKVKASQRAQPRHPLAPSSEKSAAAEEKSTTDSNAA